MNPATGSANPGAIRAVRLQPQEPLVPAAPPPTPGAGGTPGGPPSRCRVPTPGYPPAAAAVGAPDGRAPSEADAALRKARTALGWAIGATVGAGLALAAGGRRAPAAAARRPPRTTPTSRCAVRSRAWPDGSTLPGERLEHQLVDLLRDVGAQDVEVSCPDTEAVTVSTSVVCTGDVDGLRLDRHRLLRGHQGHLRRRGGLMPPTIRRAHPDELDAVGRLTVDAYVGGGVIPADAPYLAFLGDAAHRDAEAELWVAVDERGVVGTVTFVEPTSALCEIAREGEAEIRSLAVAPTARGGDRRGADPARRSGGPASRGFGRWCSRRRRRCTPRTGSTSGSASPGCPSATGPRAGRPARRLRPPPLTQRVLRWSAQHCTVGVRSRGGGPRRSWRRGGSTPRPARRGPGRRRRRCSARARSSRWPAPGRRRHG